MLGWGGYWAWDPVENASLLPWLTATAYLHSVIVEERRGMLKVWNLSLIVATFCLTILGTFLTRAGVVTSVHAFSQSAIGPLLLGFLALVIVVSVGLIGWSGDRFRVTGRVDSPLSREAAFLVNNVLFAAFAFVVLLGTVFPLIVEAVDGRQISVGEPYFDDMTRPIGITLLFLMAVAPALPWRAANTVTLHQRLVVPAAVTAAAMVSVAAAGLRGTTPVLTVGLGVFAVAGIVRHLVVAGARHRRAHPASVLPSIWRLLSSDRRLYGGLIVHVGVVLFAVAFSLSTTFSVRRETRMDVGDQVAFGGYTIEFQGMRTTREARRVVTVAQLAVARGGERAGVYEPALSTYAGMAQAIGTPSVRTTLRDDLYLVLVATPAPGTTAAVIGMQSNPLVVWLWIGGAVMAAGAAFAAWPTRRRRAAGGPAAGAAVTAPRTAEGAIPVPVPR